MKEKIARMLLSAKQSGWWYLWQLLLGNFKPQMKGYIVRVALYELNQMVASGLLSVMLLLLASQASLELWSLFFFGTAIYFYMWMRQDTDMDWHICVEHIFPVYTYLKTISFNKLMDLDMAWHEASNSAVIAKQLNRGIDKVQDTLDMVRWEFIPSAIQMAMTAAIMAWFNPLLMVLSLANSVVFFKMTWNSHKAKAKFRSKRHDLEDLEGKRFGDYTDGVAMVKTYADTFVRRNYGRILKHMTKLWNLECMLAFRKHNPQRILLLQGFKIIFWMILVYQCNQGSLSIASFVFVASLETRMYHALWRLGRIFDRISESSESVNRFSDLQKQTTLISDGVGVALPPIANIGRTIKLEDVSFQYPTVDSESALLSNISLTCNEGEVVGIVGLTGSGKSTLMKLIRRWYDLNGGRITVDGVDLKDLSLGAIQELYAVIPQADHIKIFDDTLRFNLKFVKPTATDQEIEWALAQALLLKDVRNPKLFPQGLDTKLGSDGVKLSGGQKQRLAITQAILSGRPLIIMDEPTSALDAETETFIRHNLRDLMHQYGKTVFVIAHRLRSISDWADTIIVLKNGTIVEQGTHQELCSKPDGVYRNLVEHQSLAQVAVV